MPNNEEFATVFSALRSILAAHADWLNVTNDSPDDFYANSLRLRYKGNPVMFGAVRKGKNYVSFHFMPVYMSAELQQKISSGLKKRMQGKACFNFKSVDEELFRQLTELTAAGLECFEKGAFALPGIERLAESKA